MTSVKRRESTTFLIGKLRHFVVAQKAKTLRAARDISRVWRRGLPAPCSGIGGASGLVRSEQGRNPREHAENCAAKWKALLEDSPHGSAFSTWEWLASGWRACARSDRLLVLALRD